jgi:FkbM family methyltransferase
MSKLNPLLRWGGGSILLLLLGSFYFLIDITTSIISSNCREDVFPSQNTKVMGHPYYQTGCVANNTQRKTFTAPRFFPILEFEMVLGPADKPCSYIPDGLCDQFSRGLLEWPEGFIIEALIGMLGDCPLRRCYVADFGANLGYVNSYVAALGAKVVGIEPQQDLHEANEATVETNCWKHRVKLINGLVTMDPQKHMSQTNVSHLWRPGMVEFGKVRQSHYYFIGHFLAELGSKNIDLVKIDVDSIDLEILGWLIDEMEMKNINVTSIIIESSCEPQLFFRLQQLGFDIFRMDHHLRARFFDSRGRDVYTYRGGPIQSLDLVGDEYLCRRGIKMLVKLPTAVDADDLKTNCRAMGDLPFAHSHTNVGSFLITKHHLLTPSVMESWSKSERPNTQGIYRNEKQGFPGEKINPPPKVQVD